MLRFQRGVSVKRTLLFWSGDSAEVKRRDVSTAAYARGLLTFVSMLVILGYSKAHL